MFNELVSQLIRTLDTFTLVIQQIKLFQYRLNPEFRKFKEVYESLSCLIHIGCPESLACISRRNHPITPLLRTLQAKVFKSISTINPKLFPAFHKELINYHHLIDHIIPLISTFIS
jgi:hypothetical protein